MKVVFTFILILCLFIESAFCDSQGILNNIKSAYETRRKKVSAIMLKVKLKEIDKAGSYSLYAPEVKGKIEPPRDEVLNRECVYIISGDSMHSEESGELWDLSRSEKMKTQRMKVYGQGACKQLDQDQNKKSGSISNKNEVIMVMDMRMLFSFMNLAYSPIQEHPFEIISALHDKIVLGNTDYKKIGMVGATRYEVILDANRHYVPIIFRLLTPNGDLRAEGHVSYASHTDLGYIPTSATLNMLNNNKIVTSRMMTVIESKINFPVNSDMFNINFPDGTKVYDTVSQISYIVGDAAPSKESKKILKDLDVIKLKKTNSETTDTSKSKKNMHEGGDHIVTANQSNNMISTQSPMDKEKYFIAFVLLIVCSLFIIFIYKYINSKHKNH